MSEPETPLEVLAVFLGAVITLWLAMQIIFVAFGDMEVHREDCAAYPQTWGGLLAPGYWVGCKLSEPIRRRGQ